MHSYLLVLRFAVLNVVLCGLLAAVYLQGWGLDRIESPMTWKMCLGIFGVFAVGLALCATKIVRTSLELNRLRAGRPPPVSRAGKHLQKLEGLGPESRGVFAALLRLRLAGYIGSVRYIANSLVFLGLIGTVIGFIVALSGVDPKLSASVDNIATMVSTLIAGMSVALYTTLVGAVLHVWLTLNHRLLATGTMHLYNAIVELGEERARR